VWYKNPDRSFFGFVTMYAFDRQSDTFLAARKKQTSSSSTPSETTRSLPPQPATSPINGVKHYQLPEKAHKSDTTETGLPST